MKDSNDFHHVSYAVVDYVGSFGKLAVAWRNLIADVTDRVIFTNKRKRFIKLPKVVVSLCLPPSSFSEPTDSEQILSSGSGDPELAFSHLRSRPARRSQIPASNCRTRFPRLLAVPAVKLEPFPLVPQAAAGLPVLPRSPNRSGLPPAVGKRIRQSARLM